MEKFLFESSLVITEKRKWLTYTYFNQNPLFRWNEVDLFSPVKKNIPGMTRISFPTMIIDLKKENLLDHWSKSAKYKVNRAEKENLLIKRGQTLLPYILQLFKKTAQAKGLRGYTEDDFLSKPWMECSGIFEGDKLLAGHVWLVDTTEKRVLLFVNASDHHEDSLDSSLVGRAHYFLLWKDAVYFQEKGFTIMDLNGYASDSIDPALKGVYTWKEATHGQTEELFQYYPFHVLWLRKFRNMVAR